ncbi:MAG: SLC13 family permease [Candidatus Omnitrophica bacterium]|nr:SLC13 family permease [Candidatus Omnitrophota bacterium]
MNKRIFLKLIGLVLTVSFVGFLAKSFGLNFKQALSISIFLASILGSLLFWDFRLSFAFLGTSILLLFKAIDLENLIKSASLEVVLFLVGMMILIGLLKRSGFFVWLVMLILQVKNLTAKKLFISISIISALLACAVDEVTSIIFMVAAIFQICDFFEINPIPFLMASVLATNIGSTGTVLGNPIGILIAAKSGLTFEDFIFQAFPLMLVCLSATIFLLFFWYRRPLQNLDKKIKTIGSNEIFLRLISVPPDKNLRFSLFIAGLTLFFIALHHRLELLLNLEANTILLIIPLIFAAFVMIWKYKYAREFVEHDVEWWTLLFFLFLFGQAGTLQYTGAVDFFTKRLSFLFRDNYTLLVGVILWLSAIGSSCLDNVVLVTAFLPIIKSFEAIGIFGRPLWWALLFGGCLGGNITLVGSTANIVVLGILEKEKKLKIKFFEWLKIGLIVGILTILIVWIILTLSWKAK